jgi:hypothetical protein
LLSEIKCVVDKTKNEKAEMMQGGGSQLRQDELGLTLSVLNMEKP